MTVDITRLLTNFHEDLIDGNYSDAWTLLSARKRQQALAQGSYDSWVANQKSLGNYLTISHIAVSIKSASPESGVALVDVTGMRYNGPNASCDWTGLTWVKYESGGWHYDPGFSTTPAREAQWKPKFSQLLGGACGSD